MDVDWVRAIRVCWGTLLLLAPGTVLSVAGDSAQDAHAAERPVLVLRVLGARHLLQSQLLKSLAYRPFRYWGAGIDAVQAITAAAAARHWPNHRRAASADAVVASLFAAAGLVKETRHACMQVHHDANSEDGS